MCLAVPGKIISIDKSNPSAITAVVSFGGILKQVCLDFLPDSQTGDYVMVHVGFAISKIDEQEAEETLRIVSETEAFISERLKNKTLRK